MLNKTHQYAIGAFVFMFALSFRGINVQAATKAPTKAVPAHITVPAAHVNADIISVDVTKTGHLDVPPNFVQAGWYDRGPVPGMPGSAVIDGHVDNAGSVNGPFKHLKEAKPGDKIYVAMSDGTTKKFVVTDSSAYPLSKFPSKSVFIGDSSATLKIITCHGKFVKSLGTYDQRLIVTAVLEA